MEANVLNYSDPATVIAKAEPGDVIYFPAGAEYVAPPGGWKITKSLEIRGDGPGNPDNPNSGTVLRPSPSTSPPPSGEFNDVFVLDPAPGADLSGVHIHDLMISGAGVTGGGHDGIRLKGGADKKLADLRLRWVSIVGMSGAGISLLGAPAEAGHVVGVLVEGCSVESCGAEGIVLENAFGVCGRNTRIAGNGREGIRALASELVLYVCSLDGNRLTGGDASVYVFECGLARFDACRFENFGAVVPALVMIRCQGVGQVGGCVFRLPTFQAGAKAIVVGAPPIADGPMLILPNQFAGVGVAVQVLDFATACTVCPQYFDSLDGTGSTPIILPSLPPDSPLAIPSIYTPSGNKLAGLLVPPFATDPSSNVQGGMLARVGGSVRVYVGESPSGQFEDLAAAPAPDAIADLAFGALAGKTTLTVEWTAPIEPNWTGPVAKYEIRYATWALNDGNFNTGTLLPEAQTPLPAEPLTGQCARIPGLSPCTTYYAAIKCLDHSGQWSQAGATSAGKKTRCSGTGEVDCV